MSDRPVICRPGLPDDIARELAEGWIAPASSSELDEAHSGRRPLGRNDEGAGRTVCPSCAHVDHSGRRCGGGADCECGYCGPCACSWPDYANYAEVGA